MAVTMDDKRIHHGANKTLGKTIQGWYLQILWHDGNTLCESL